MPVKQVPTLGWTRGDVAATITLVTKQQREAIAARVREGMAREGLTNASLARKADLAEKTISRLINARLEPRYDTLERVAKALNVSEKELRGSQSAPLGLDAEPLEAPVPDDTSARILKRLDAIEEELRLLRVEQLARVMAILRRLDEASPTKQAPPRRRRA